MFNLAKGLAEAGFDIVTGGGGPGIMQAANAGHRSVRSGSHSIGLNIKLPFEQEANKYLDIKKDFDRFSSRLDTFMSLSDAVIVAPGGIGTIIETFYSWQLVQVQHICETPIIFYGDMWRPLIEWLRTEVLARGLMDSKDLHHVFHVTSVESLLSLIMKVHQDRSELEYVCVNYQKYSVEYSGWEKE